ncbi:hypothetical protein GCM10022199_10750 [Marihabitans asiaticum]|uniref:Polyketide cyclase/dehydrase/lipid transport protein n=1 Tax=Marihabitans asiaticum TaxID=415218 RepID=A0A560WHF5_9MICO|nr:polyketide cyclase/dehydrase/lipid transport protein [Marihabitans asiaticum]
MTSLVRATGPAPADEVWRRYTTPDTWSSWAPQIRGVRCDDPVIRPGTKGEVLASPVGRIPFVITDVDESARRWSWRVGPGPGVPLDHGVDEVGEGVTAWVVVHAPAVLVIGYRPLAWWALHRLVS